VLTDDPDRARALVAAGREVVLMVAPGSDPVPFGGGPGRLAVIVGDPADPAVRAAAEAMDRELFGR
jgi:hypothetical protein